MPAQPVREQALAMPITEGMIGGSECIHEAEFLYVSYDDDSALGWLASKSPVPVNEHSPAGKTHGTTSERDEVVGMVLTGAGRGFCARSDKISDCHLTT